MSKEAPLPRLAMSLPASPRMSRRVNTARSMRTTAFSTGPKVGHSHHRNFGISSTRMLPLREAWAAFLKNISVLAKDCRIDATNPLFMNRITDLQKTFENFDKFAIIIFNSIHPDGDNRAHLEQSAIWQSAKLLVNDWQAMIFSLNELIKEGCAPYYRPLTAALTDLRSALERVARLFLVGSLKSEVSTKSIDRIYAAIDMSKEMIENQLMGATEQLDARFTGTLERVIARIQRMFDNAMPRYRMSSGEVMLEKMALAVATNTVVELTNGMKRFGEAALETRSSTIDLNLELSKLFAALRVPFSLKLNVTEENIIEITNERTKLSVTCPPPPRAPATARSPRRKLIDSL